MLGDHEAQRYQELADEVARLTWARWRDHATTTQTGAAVAVELGIAPAEEHERIGAALARLVRDADGRIATGFLGTPLVLPALTRTGHVAEAYLMLLRRELPSWLYQVTRGATTVWERWDAIRADGSIHDGRLVLPDHESEMLSFNHYAYGAVVDWVYRHVAGIAPDAEAPGYQHVILAPRPVDGIDSVTASVETALGTVAVEWSTDGGRPLLGPLRHPVRRDGDLRSARRGGVRRPDRWPHRRGIGHNGCGRARGRGVVRPDRQPRRSQPPVTASTRHHGARRRREERGAGDGRAGHQGRRHPGRCLRGHGEQRPQPPARW